jgi:6-phosphofructo-2-kinase
MRLKLRGPDYKNKDPESSYEDFKKRVAAYESAYVPIGKYEEDNNMQYIKMIDVGRKMINYQVSNGADTQNCWNVTSDNWLPILKQLSGFLTGGIASYLSTFNLSPRQIWITRHGKSVDNCLGKIGGDSPLTESGRHYGTALYNFINTKRKVWEEDQKRKALESTALPPKVCVSRINHSQVLSASGR